MSRKLTELTQVADASGNTLFYLVDLDRALTDQAVSIDIDDLKTLLDIPTGNVYDDTAIQAEIDANTADILTNTNDIASISAGSATGDIVKAENSPVTGDKIWKSQTQTKSQLSQLTTSSYIEKQGVLSFGFVLSDGTVNVNTFYKKTGFIPVFEGQSVLYKGFAGGSSAKAMAGYDENQVFVSLLIETGDFVANPDEIIIPNGVSFIRGSSRASDPDLILQTLETELKPKPSYANTYDLPNKAKDLFDGHLILRGAGGVEGSGNVANGTLRLATGFTNTVLSDAKFNSAYKIENGGNPIPPYTGNQSNERNEFLELQENAINGIPNIFEDTTFGFWVDRNELDGNTLVFTESSVVYFIAAEEMLIEGFSNGLASVVKVQGQYTYVQCTRYQNFNLCIRDGNAITSFTIYNPTILDGTLIDPDHIYKSKSEQNNSPNRGKWVMLLGDSQQNQGLQIKRLQYETGCNAVFSAIGGFSMKYRASNNWLYDKDVRKLFMSVDYIDYYLFCVSSNDKLATGEPTLSNTNAVLDNYYVWGDDQSTEDAKQVLFDAMDDATKIATFEFSQTYSAYLKQIQTAYPKAKVIICSTPINQNDTTEYDVDGVTTIYKTGKNADDERTLGDTYFPIQREKVIALSNKHNTAFCDLYLSSGITYENFPSKVYGTDSVHWIYSVKDAMGYEIAKTMNGLQTDYDSFLKFN